MEKILEEELEVPLEVGLDGSLWNSGADIR